MTIRDEVYTAFGMAKDTATSKIEITYDTSRWSTRKRNIVIRAIDVGMTDCGYATGHFVSTLLERYGLTTEKFNMWNEELAIKAVRPDKVDEIVSYVSAMLKMKTPTDTDKFQHYYRPWRLVDAENRFNSSISAGKVPTHIPLPEGFTKKEKREFVVKYLKPCGEVERIKRDELINKVKSGASLSISYNI